jgi:cardiolipin synthase (CMP-forming)
MSVVSWFRRKFIPWTRGRMFRTGIPLDQSIEVTDRIFTAANGITVARLLGLPVFIILTVRHAWLSAFLLLAVLVLLDSVDGYVARRFNQATRLGRVLDPMTDRATMVAVGITLCVAGVIYWWLVALIVLRDLALLLLAFIAAYTKLSLVVSVRDILVTRLGKLATLVLFTSLPILLLSRLTVFDGTPVHIIALGLACVGIVLYYAAFAQYLKTAISGRQRPAAGPARDLRASAPHRQDL